MRVECNSWPHRPRVDVNETGKDAKDLRVGDSQYADKDHLFVTDVLFIQISVLLSALAEFTCTLLLLPFLIENVVQVRNCEEEGQE